MSPPNFTICALEDGNRFYFPSKPKNCGREGTPSCLPVTMKDIKCCDWELIGTADPRDLRQFIKEYEEKVSKLCFEGQP